MREDVRLACAQTLELFVDLHGPIHVPLQLSAKEQKIHGDSQASPLPIFPEGGGTSVHRLRKTMLFGIAVPSQSGFIPFKSGHQKREGLLWLIARKKNMISLRSADFVAISVRHLVHF